VAVCSRGRTLPPPHPSQGPHWGLESVVRANWIIGPTFLAAVVTLATAAKPRVATHPGFRVIVRDWIVQTATGLGLNEMVLNIAGPRESEAKGVYVAASRFLTGALQAR